MVGGALGRDLSRRRGTVANRWTGHTDLEFPHLELLHVARLQHAGIRIRAILEVVANGFVRATGARHRCSQERGLELFFLLIRVTHDERSPAYVRNLLAG